MITKVGAFKTSDGRTFETIEQAQQNEVEILLGVKDDKMPGTVAELSNLLMEHKDKLVDILTTTPSSKPRARSINGGRKKRKVTPDPAVVTAKE